MANYTIELRQVINGNFPDIFGFDYPFYTDDKEIKKEFEELFINRFYYHEIGAETFDRWQHMLKTKLLIRMPYYRQLYQTEWEQTGKNMMNSKDLTETTSRKLKSSDKENGIINGETSMNQTDQSTGESLGTGEHDESYLSDGVHLVNTETGNKTGTTKDKSQATSQSSSFINANTVNQTNTQNTNQLDLEEETTFHSHGDIGIQTPAYAITEWRKVIININEMILEECESLFMQIY